MKFQHKLTLLTSIATICVLLVFFMSPIAQDINYHNFIDNTTFFNISNFNNVISNLGFIAIAFYGLINNKRRLSENPLVLILLLGLLLTGIGSSYYHWKPNNYTLVYDRLPMVIVFMSFFIFIISTYISKKYVVLYGSILIIMGFGSVLYWSYTESIGKGDLRPYALIQFLPMVLIPLILILFKNKDNKSMYIFPVFGCYVLAKLFEHFDKHVFTITNEIISGHSLKHLISAIATYYIYKWMYSLQKIV